MTRQKLCPCENDCVFLHEIAEKCKFEDMCEQNFCVYRHEYNDDDVANDFEANNTPIDNGAKEMNGGRDYDSEQDECC